MRNKIIEESILLLKEEGLIFSVDDLAKKMKVGKQTIYQFFKTKEELAIAVFDKIYTDIISKINIAKTNKELLLCLKDAIEFNDDKLFNRYSINEKVKNKVLEKLEECKKLVKNKIRCSSSQIEGFMDLLCASIKESISKNISLDSCEEIFMR